MNKERGFTLVELSIVLVIIGLIVGGVVGGQALIASARMSKQVQQLQQFKIAYNAFQLQYDAMPGDFSEATDYWTAGVTSNGNGNGELNRTDGTTYVHQSSYSGEFPLFFQHLSLAEVIPVEYDGSSVLGEGAPRMALNDSFGFIATTDVSYIAGSSCPQNGLMLYLGLGNPSALPDLNSADGGNTFTPEQAKKVDNKLDDGIATKGVFCAWNSSGNTANPSGNCHANGAYNVAYKDGACRATYRIE
jgi:prepilin-type N-terminal cleavage/methylation domain-containing protein